MCPGVLADIRNIKPSDLLWCVTTLAWTKQSQNGDPLIKSGHSKYLTVKGKQGKCALILALTLQGTKDRHSKEND